MSLHKAKTYVSPLVDIIFCLAGALCIGVGIFYLFSGKIELATTGLASGLLLLFAATIDRFESLKGLGLEAKTRDLKLTIEEANQTLSQLRHLAEISGRTLSSLVAKVGRGGSAFTVKESHELSREIRKSLTDLNSDESSIVRALRPWVQGLCSELALRLSIDFVNDYRAVEQSVVAQLASIHFTPDVPNPERDTLIQFRESIERHTYKSHETEKWPAEEILTILRNQVLTAPGADDEFKARNLALIENWVDEVDYLLKFSDLKTPQLWSDRFSR